MERRFQQVDVFGGEPLRGNPLAVVLDSEGLTSEEMQRFARWMNLSETTFLLPPTNLGANYRVRIFTPTRELPFAGHPTLGSCHAWLKAGGSFPDSSVITQECEIGLVRIEQSNGQLWFQAPPLVRSGSVEEELVLEIANILGVARSEIIDANWVDNGPGWIAVMLKDAATVRGIRPDYSRSTLSGELHTGVVGFHPPGEDFAYEIRALIRTADGDVWEDPVTGSLNAAIAQWMVSSGRVRPPYLVSQGVGLGRSGRVSIRQDSNGQVWVGGHTETHISGTAEF